MTQVYFGQISHDLSFLGQIGQVKISEGPH